MICEVGARMGLPWALAVLQTPNNQAQCTLGGKGRGGGGLPKRRGKREQRRPKAAPEAPVFSGRTSEPIGIESSFFCQDFNDSLAEFLTPQFLHFLKVQA